MIRGSGRKVRALRGLWFERGLAREDALFFLNLPVCFAFWRRLYLYFFFFFSSLFF
jgi:hypothetical protein